MSISAILLAAGYGTRLRKDLLGDPQLSSLASTPKPLLPISGRPLLSHWIEQLTHPYIKDITIVTNSLHHPRYQTWRKRHRNPNIRIIANDTSSNATRRGAVADLQLAIDTIDNVDNVLIIAADTLLPGTDINAIITHFLAQTSPAGVLAYKLQNIEEASKRGMLAIKEENDATIATRLVEKPHPSEAPSHLATAPIYLLRRSAAQTIPEFLHQAREHPLEKRDAPGHWLAYLLTRMQCRVYRIPQRLDIGALEHYKHALCMLGKRHRAEEEPAVGRAFPRVGLLGNPSDGYGGKVIALAIQSEGFAEVVVTSADRFSVLPNPELEIPVQWDSVCELVKQVDARGLDFGARKLVIAAVVMFTKLYKATLPNCHISYSTTIPARIGLAGSSALILATFRALARFCQASLHDLCNDERRWCEAMQKTESEYLGIACGLMDRVIQLLQGVIYMDFSADTWTWERLKEDLPLMFLSYARNSVGESSGKVHGDLKKRYLDGDPLVTEVINSLRLHVDEGVDMITRGVYDDLPRLFTRNFELRCRLVGKESVGKENIRLVDVAKKAGFAAKMTGSGGCALCIPNPYRKLSDVEVDAARQQFEEDGFVLRRVQVLKALEWGD